MTIYNKICTKCKISKSMIEFSKDNSKIDGRCSSCKSCKSNHYHRNKKHILEHNKKYQENNRATLSIKRKKYYEDNKESRNQWSREYYQENKEYLISKSKEYRKNNRNAVSRARQKYESIQRSTDPLYKLRCRLRTLIWYSMKRGGFKKNSKTELILGCSFEEFKLHIEAQFTEGMSWNNYGEWHYDHKTPVSWATSEDEIVALNHFSNFQPKWAEDNWTKGNKYSE